MQKLKASEIVEPGAYEWHLEGVRHVGFVTKRSRGKLHGSFVAQDGALQSWSIVIDGEFCEGDFYGPLLPLNKVASGATCAVPSLNSTAGRQAPATRGLKRFSGCFDGKIYISVVCCSKKRALALLGVTESTFRAYGSVAAEPDEQHQFLWDDPEKPYTRPSSATGSGSWTAL